PKLPFKPVFIQTDNGLEFQGRFRKILTDLKLKHHYVHKRTPNENALIERTLRTDEEEFFFRMKQIPEHYDELRTMFAEWLYRYNYKRIHLGINLKTPYEVVANVLGD
ncbi:integrase core domain-containing protein, partial [Patescibacteria group bacterium]|nr:integrase core domain-containing protein [Patescibacteria group bacterium]